MTLSSLGRGYLLSRPYVYNGGLIGQLISNLLVADSTTNFNININSSLNIPKYLSGFFFDLSTSVPNFNNFTISYNVTSTSNLATSVCGILYVIVIVIFGLIIGLVWICSRLCKFNQTCQIGRKKNSQVESQDFHFATNDEIKEDEKKNLNKRLILCTVSFFFSLVSIIFYLLSVGSQINLEIYAMDPNMNSSFVSTWQRSSYQMNTFFDLATNGSYNIFNQTINNMSIALNNVLFGSLNNLTTGLLQYFGVLTVFTNANEMILNLSQTIQSMQYIANNTNPVIATINSQTGFLQTTVQSLLISMSNVCGSMTQSAICLKYLNDTRFFRINIETSLISDRSSVTMMFIISEFNLNITSIGVQLTAMQINLNKELAAQTNLQISQLNLPQSVQKMSSVWTFISQTVSPWITSFSSLGTSLTSFVNTLGLAILIMISVLLVLVAVLIILSIVTIFRYSFLYYYRRKLLIMYIQSENGVQVSFKRLKRSIYRIENQYDVRNGLVYSYIVIFSSVIFLILLFSIILINASHLIYNEACIQFWRLEGQNISENFLDVFLNKNWKSFLLFVLSKNFPIELTFPQPTNVINKIFNNCTTDKGIFNALQMKDFVNISAFLWSAQNLKSLNNGLNITFNALLASNVAGMMPKDMTTFLKDASTIGTYFGATNYQATIDELSKGVIALQNYSSWLNNAIQFFSTINTPDSLETIRLLNALNADVRVLQGLEVNILNLKNNFQIIQDKRSSAATIQSLSANITNVKNSLANSESSYNAVKSIYGQIMQTEFPIYAEASVNNLLAYLIAHLFPCANLASAVTMLLDNLCTTDSTIEKISSTGLYISITCAFLMAMMHSLWVIIRRDKIEKEKNVSTC